MLKNKCFAAMVLLERICEGYKKWMHIIISVVDCMLDKPISFCAQLLSMLSMKVVYSGSFCVHTGVMR